MRPTVLHHLLLCSLCLAFYCLCHADEFLKSGSHEWKKLIMVHHWPTTVCKEIENECTHPPDYWTIHGLWPDKAEDCNGSWPFNLTEIEDLLPVMRKFWPDLIHPNRSRFWKHEWDKHGTCAAQLDSLNSEKKYFGTSLDLYKELDLNSMLQKLGIKPSLNYYQRESLRIPALEKHIKIVLSVLCLSYGVTGKNLQKMTLLVFATCSKLLLGNSNLEHLIPLSLSTRSPLIISLSLWISDIKDALAGIYGVIPKIQCLPPKQDEKVQMLGQIELCLTKELELRNCTEPGELHLPRQEASGAGVAAFSSMLSVCEDGPAFYPPPDETKR